MMTDLADLFYEDVKMIHNMDKAYAAVVDDYDFRGLGNATVLPDGCVLVLLRHNDLSRSGGQAPSTLPKATGRE